MQHVWVLFDMLRYNVYAANIQLLRLINYSNLDYESQQLYQVLHRTLSTPNTSHPNAPFYHIYVHHI